jgi:predicted nucleic acid-binding protein
VAVFFLDSSAVVKRYVAEIGSAWVQALTAPAAGNRCWLSAVTGVEVLAAFYRRVRTGTLALPQARTIEAAFRLELSALFRPIPPDVLVLGDAMRLVAAHPLRAYDAVQLASALALRSQNAALGLPTPVFVSADNDLRNAAALEGLLTDDPNLHP